MTKPIYTLLSLLFLNGTMLAQQKPDATNVNKLCGCFDVEFKYAETFSPDQQYKFHDRDEISGGTEYIFPVEVADRKIVLQHLLVITDSMIIKHWREDWTYENPVRWVYKGNKTWEKTILKPEEVKGKWTQSVWEVSDAPRYQGASDWVVLDGKLQWQNTADAPLPRREYSVRSDYNILRRTNTIIIGDSGWVHDQNNQKIIRQNGVDRLLVEEKGINSYHRVDESACAGAKIYWERNKDFWTRVRKTWDNYTVSHTVVQLKGEVNGKVLHDVLFEQAKQYAKGEIKAGDLDALIRNTVESYFGQESDKIATK